MRCDRPVVWYDGCVSTPRSRLLDAIDAHARGPLAAAARRWVAAKSDDNLVVIVTAARAWVIYILGDSEVV